jgi:hypothetical protein
MFWLATRIVMICRTLKTGEFDAEKAFCPVLCTSPALTYLTRNLFYTFSPRSSKRSISEKVLGQDPTI